MAKLRTNAEYIEGVKTSVEAEKSRNDAEVIRSAQQAESASLLLQVLEYADCSFSTDDVTERLYQLPVLRNALVLLEDVLAREWLQHSSASSAAGLANDHWDIAIVSLGVHLDCAITDGAQHDRINRLRRRKSTTLRAAVTIPAALELDLS